MRFHQLSMTAFGPYAATQSVDFDELNDAGIFLLTGPTGAGKTSILDAICFALYGVVPGVREVKTLRSHHAADGVAPEVVLEVTIGERHYRVRRSPEWHRPKKRGDGTTKENACASLVVLEDDGTERLVSSRIAEVSHELAMAIGMSSEQFMQVVMLPQGDFQRFLQASSDERQVVLQKLFRTQRFSRIEEWMKDRTRQLGERAAQAERRVCQLLATIADRAATPVPEVLAEDRLGDVGSLARRWAEDALTAARTEHDDAVAVERLAQEELDRLRLDEQRAVQLAATMKKHADARRLINALDEDRAEAAADAARHERHEAALLVRPLLQPLQELQDAAGRAATARETALTRLAALPVELQPEPLDRSGCTAVVRELTDRLAVLRAVLPREAALQRAGTDMQTALGARDELRAELEGLTSRTEALPAEREQVNELLGEHRLEVHGIADARAALVSAQAQHDATSRLPAVRAAHDRLTSQHLLAREETAAAREHHLDVVERRLAGMAAELAGQLADDQPCQVCGGVEHPAPAQPLDDAVTEHDQQLAAADADRLRSVVDGLAEKVAESSRELQSLEAVVDGLSPAEAAERLDGCRDTVASAEAAAVLLDELQGRAAELDREHQDVSARLLHVREQIAARDSEIVSLKKTFADTARAIADAVGPGGGSVEERIRGLQRTLDEVERAAVALDANDIAEARVLEARTRADTEARAQGFGTAIDAAGALLDRATADSLTRRLEERDEQRRSATAALADAVDTLDEDVAPDVEATRALLAAATDEWRRANNLLGSAAQCASSLAALVDQLEAALTDWEPARAEHTTAEGMAKLVRGMGGDNQLQMRLSSYVLATRLDQVLEAANERLSQMRDQRYTLRRCGRTRGGARAGLGLEVLDTWTGEARAPSTLSGGETFVVSLALALGLADVVGEEAGGVRVDTLFIDEGFGMLDPETLDDVMDSIDALRAGGRVVGVVSHVTELRGRIHTQVHVERGRSGSSVAVRTLVA